MGEGFSNEIFCENAKQFKKVVKNSKNPFYEHM
jgi:hypothetical protein